jgi:integrase
VARDKGSGSIHQRRDGRWVAQLTVEGKTITKSSKDQAEVKRWLKEKVKDAHQGFFATGSNPTVREWFTDWMAGRDVEPRTKLSYELTLKRIDPYIGSVRLDKLTENHIKTMWLSLRDGKGPDGAPKRPLAATTLRTCYAHLKTVLEDAVRSNSVALRINPAANAKPGRPAHKEMEPLTEVELLAFLSATKEDREYPIWLTLFTTGLRVGELVGLKVDDVSLEDGVLKVKRGAYRAKGQGIVEGNTKTKKGRTVDVPATTLTVLRDHLTVQKVKKMAHRDVWEDRGYVFTTESGRAIDPRFLNKKFTQALDTAGLKDRKLHNTRHTYATILFSKGEHPKVVQEQMGHSSVKITLDVYSAYIPTMGRSAADRMETLFAS